MNKDNILWACQLPDSDWEQLKQLRNQYRMDKASGETQAQAKKQLLEMAEKELENDRH